MIFAAPDEPLRGTVHGHASWHYEGCTPYDPCKPVSGSTWTGKVDGVTVYTGTDDGEGRVFGTIDVHPESREPAFVDEVTAAFVVAR